MNTNTNIQIAFKSKKAGKTKRNRNFKIVDFVSRIPVETKYGPTYIDVEWSAFVDEFGTLEDARQTSKWGVKAPTLMKAAIQEAVNAEYKNIKFDDLPDRPRGTDNTKTEDELKEGAASAESKALAELA